MNQMYNSYDEQIALIQRHREDAAFKAYCWGFSCGLIAGLVLAAAIVTSTR